MATNDLTAEVLRQHLDYDPISGKFFRKRASGTAHIGDVAGWSEPHGYIKLNVAGKKYYAHRCAFLFMNGAWPVGVVDHVDGNRANNTWSNLREVSHAVNLQNLKGARSDNKIGLLGVHFHKGAKKFTASICVDGRSHYLGLFNSAQEAGEAYLLKKRVLHEGGML
jgi:hypothetical protein